MGARCRHSRKVGSVTASAHHHPEMVGVRVGAKKDETIKFIVDNLKLKRYIVARIG